MLMRRQPTAFPRLSVDHGGPGSLLISNIVCSCLSSHMSKGRLVGDLRRCSRRSPNSYPQPSAAPRAPGIQDALPSWAITVTRLVGVAIGRLINAARQTRRGLARPNKLIKTIAPAADKALKRAHPATAVLGDDLVGQAFEDS